MGWGGCSAQAIRAEVARIATSAGFAHSDHRKSLLRFLVEKTLKGEADQIKEYLLGVEVLSRPASFDPQSDPIVRVEAKRLRQKLETYYLDEGKDDPVIIQIPSGHYSPVFLRRGTWFTRIRPRLSWLKPRYRWSYLVLSLLLLLVAIGTSRTVEAPNSGRAAADDKVNQAPLVRSRHSLLVLPFVELDSRRGNELADQLTDEIISAAARLDGVNVIGRTTAFRFKNRGEDIRDIGAELHVALVLEGSVRRVNGGLRILLRLISTADGLSLWSGTFEAPENQSATWPETVAKEITSSLQVELGQLISASENTLRGRDLSAHDEYLRGLYDFNRGGQVGLEDSLMHFQQSIRTSPNYAPPYAQLAAAYCLLGLSGALPPAEVLPKARVAAFKALSLDSRLGTGYASVGLIDACYLWNWSAAEEAFDRALELAPENPEVVQEFVLAYLVPQGRLDEGLARLKHLMAAHPTSVLTRELLIQTYFFRQEYGNVFAYRLDDKGGESYAESTNLAVGLAWEQMSHFNEAISAFRGGEGVWSRSLKCSLLAHVYGRMGNVAKARGLIADLKKSASGGYLPASYLALPYLGLGEKEQALACLENAFEARCPDLVFLTADPRYGPLRTEPRFTRLLKKIGLE